MQKLELFDETFDPFRTESYELSIQVSLNGFSFCVRDLTRNCFIAFGSIPFELNIICPDDWAEQLEIVVRNCEWLSNPFKKVLFSFESPSFTLVPSYLFELEMAKEFLSLAHPINELDEIRTNNVNDDIVNVFNVPSVLITSWLKVHSNTQVIGFCDPLIRVNQTLNLTNPNPLLTLSFARGFAVVIFSKLENLLHCGTVEISSIEDIIYHMVNICNHLGFNPEEVEVNTIGSFDHFMELQNLTERFFKSSKEISTVDHFHFSYLLNKYKNKYSNLFNLSLCE